MAAFQILGRSRTFSCTFRPLGRALNVTNFNLHNNGPTFSRKKHNYVGFIGLGNMGGPMALNLLSKGHQLIVYDVNPDSMTILADQGAMLGNSPADVAAKAETIITMLPTNKHVHTVYNGNDGIFESLRAGSLLIDSSTVDPSLSKDELAPKASLAGAAFLDAPVSGGINAAKGGTLTFMVGGPGGEVEAAKELLLAMGSKVVHCGPVGAGQAAKICNNMLLGISMIGTAEAMNLGIRLGLEPKLLMNILNSSSGRCWSSEVYNPVPDLLPNVPASNKYQGGFGNRLMTKDLGLAQTAASKAGVATPLGALAHQIYSLLAINPQFSDLDFSSVYKLFNFPNDDKTK